MSSSVLVLFFCKKGSVNDCWAWFCSLISKILKDKLEDFFQVLIVISNKNIQASHLLVSHSGSIAHVWLTQQLAVSRLPKSTGTG